MAGNDEKAMATLRRFTSPETLHRSYNEWRSKVSAGELKPVLGKEFTPEDVANYRKAWDIPEAPDKYGVEFPKVEGWEPSEADKADLKSFLEGAHAAHIPRSQAQAMVNKYLEIRQAGEQQMREAAIDKTVEQQSTIRAEWGKDWKMNANMIKADLEKVLGKDEAVGLVDLVLSDGTVLGNHPAFLRYAAQAARRTVDDSAFAMAESKFAGTDPEARMRELNALQDTDLPKWRSNEVQDELMSLANIIARKRAA